MGLRPFWALGHALAVRAPLIVWSPRDPVGVPLGLALVIAAGLSARPAPDLARGQRPPPLSRRDRRLAAAGLIGIALCLLGAGLTAPIATSIADAHARGAGYRACPALTERPARSRWTLARCPGSWEESDRMEGR